MPFIIDLFSLLTAAAGWYYVFYSRAARRLEGLEERGINVRRIRLRRVGGGAMMLLGVLFFVGFQRWIETSAGVFLAVWLGVLCLLAAIVALGLIDLRLTWKLRNLRGRGPQS
jgi:UDP-N-acetylmuramyl pentapeptide phosphotransferase/UDP-N-acetylglucosamine-1-phosphate transferase